MTMYFIKVSHTKTLLLLWLTLISFTSLQAQNKSKEVYDFTFKNANLEDIVKVIEQSSSYSFIFSEDIKLAKKMNIQIKGKNISELLENLFDEQPITFQINGKHIILQKKKLKPVSRRFTISGYVTDETSQETLIGANVFESRHQEGTSTNPYGFYSITMPEGENNILFSYIGYASQTHKMELKKDTVINMKLKTNTQLQEVVILSNRPETGLKATQMGAMDIPLEHIKNTPSLLGEADVMKTIQLMPGVQSGAEGSAGVYVRGGSPDQNLILLDGVPVYNVDHLFGFFSVFTPEAVKKVSMFKSSFPARFGGRLSSVIDIRTNDGDMNKYHGSLSIGLLSSKLTFEGPIIKDKTSFNFSARRSYLDLLTDPFMSKEEEKTSYYFYDVNAKINHRFSDKSRLFVSFYNGKDKFKHELDNESANLYNNLPSNQSKTNNLQEVYFYWGNTIAALRWNYIFNNKLFSNTTISYNKYQFNLASKTSEVSLREKELSINKYDFKYQSGIQDLGYNLDFDYNPVPSHHIRFGANYLYHQFRPEVMINNVEENKNGNINYENYTSKPIPTIYAHEVSAYIEDDFNISSKVSMNVGVNLSSFFVQQKYYSSIQPRLSAKYEISNNYTVKASYSRTCQYIHLLTSSSLSLPTDLWVPITKDIKPMSANQYSIGAYYSGIKNWEFSIESYYKNMNNVLDYKDGSNYIGISTGWESNVEMGKGRSFGIEFMIQKSLGKSTGWIAYTLSKSDRIFSNKGVNGGNRFPYKYDRRHNLNIVFNHKFSNKIDICSSWSYYSGGCTTLAEEEIAVIRPSEKINDGLSYDKETTIRSENYVEKKCNYRLPATHLLNIGINFHKKTKRGMSTWNIGVYNVYNRMNPTIVLKETKTIMVDGKEERKPFINKITVLPFIPSVTYTYKF